MLKKLRKYTYELYEDISYRGVNDQQSNADRDLRMFLNRYFILCSFIFLVHGIFNVLYFPYFTWDRVALFFFSILTMVLNRIIIGSRFLKPILGVIICMLTIVITYYSSFCGLESGVFLFYFPLITVFPLFFNIKTEKPLIIILLVFVLIMMYISVISDFKLIEKNRLIENYARILLTLNITLILVIFSLNFFFFFDKRKDYDFILHRNAWKRMEIESLSQEIIRLKKMLNKDDFSEEKLEELINCIHMNDVTFLERFDYFFPEFKKKLIAISESPLNVSELKLCALLKLGFSTKQIALYTNSTIKSVEGKKYRLKKKLNLSSTSDYKVWFAEF